MSAYLVFNLSVYLSVNYSTNSDGKLYSSYCLSYRGSTPQSYCYSYPGVNLAMQKTSLEQIVSLARGSTGCLSSFCQIQKYIAIALSKRNEHQRGDRDTYITMAAIVAVPVSGVLNFYSNGTDTQCVWLSVRLSVCLYLCLHICLLISVFACLSVSLPACLSACMPDRMSVHMSASQ